MARRSWDVLQDSLEEGEYKTFGIDDALGCRDMVILLLTCLREAKIQTQMWRNLLSNQASNNYRLTQSRVETLCPFEVAQAFGA